MNTYFDNASTSFPEPPQVAEAITRYLTVNGGTYGRAAYGRIVETARMVEACREKLAQRLGVANGDNICFTANATTAINTILRGISSNISTIYTTPLEHNAVMRPLTDMVRKGLVKHQILPSLSDGVVDVDNLPPTDANTLIIINHQSNVSGVIQPIAAIRQKAPQARLLIDTTQSLGSIDVTGDQWQADYIAFTGHKGLLGPTGIGGFYVRQPESLQPLVFGGTGSNSDSFEMPPFMPDKFEAGTPNIVGIAGLLGALENTPQPAHSHNDLLRLMSEVGKINEVNILKAKELKQQGNLFSFWHNTLKPSVIARYLYEQHQIEVRQGLHCAPMAHGFYGTMPDGTVRIALSPYHTPQDIDYLINAITQTIQYCLNR
jgi:cysteine desulfurase family protein